MPIKVTISLLRETRNLRILDRYDNNRILYEVTPSKDALPLPPRITLDSVTTNGASPPVGKLQIQAEVLERDDKDTEKWARVDQPFTVKAGENEWPPDGTVLIVRALFKRWSAQPER